MQVRLNRTLQNITTHVKLAAFVLKIKFGSNSKNTFFPSYYMLVSTPMSDFICEEHKWTYLVRVQPEFNQLNKNV